MLKFTFLIRRVEGMTKEEFVNYHRNHHAPLFMSHPEVGKYVKKYVVSHPVEIAGFPAPEFDGITDIYFSSLDDYNTFFANEYYKQHIQPDEPKFFKSVEILMLVTDEKVVVDHIGS
ncbi:EthD domain-containing protein [Chitinophaga sancti]|uniref:EthD domain-containing protein n=1 Tax=Chitinophaga sancti TaxID=1004 RepID=UPI002A7534D3|nr:EthD domain-containing protein [Chitinophaga sancti]WPQ61672.1 EthD domain-containing protein [Chitinophaga sancti]